MLIPIDEPTTKKKIICRLQRLFLADMNWCEGILGEDDEWWGDYDTEDFAMCVLRNNTEETQNFLATFRKQIIAHLQQVAKEEAYFVFDESLENHTLYHVKNQSNMYYGEIEDRRPMNE